MSVYKDIIIDIQEDIQKGKLTFSQIAEKYNVSIYVVNAIWQEMIDQEENQVNFLDSKE